MQFLLGIVVCALMFYNWDSVQPVLLHVLEYLTNLIK
jgi:hypothetical protein